MISRLLKNVTTIGCFFLITFTQVYSLTWETSTISTTATQNLNSTKEINLIVTWYYSPLPNQETYLTWNYEDEISLNWDGVWMASWKSVYTWAIAAPKSLDFWTKIYIDWYWVWAVEDRWWSIIDDEDIRIDIWMWYGDEWLQRAINWWTKKLKWYIVDSWTKISLELKTWVEDSYKKLSLNPDSSSDDVKKVQEFFKEIGFYDWEIDWIYENIKPIIVKYQIQKWIITSEDDSSAWYFWPKTISALYSDFWLWIKYDYALDKTERDSIKSKINIIKNKLWTSYNTKIQKTLNDIKKLESNDNLSLRNKTILNYLEFIL